MYVAFVVKKECPNYDDKQMRLFLMWNIERTMKLVEGNEEKVLADFQKEKSEHSVTNPEEELIGSDSNPTGAALEYIQKVRTSPEGEEIRNFARQYFGADWCKRVYGF
jgi:hypothetical protein